MIGLVARLWPFLLAAGLAGLLLTALLGRGRGALSSRLPVLLAALLLFGALAICSGLQLVAGRPGLWLDIAVLVAGSYGLGCGLAALGRLAWRGVDKGRGADYSLASSPASSPAAQDKAA